MMNDNKILEKLKTLNTKVGEAIAERKKFLDENMHLFTEFKTGQKVYNVKNGHIGICSKHYRYWSERNDLLDTDFSVHCEINEPEQSNLFDNTSRFSGTHPWVKLEDYENKSECYLEKLEIIARS